MNEKRKGKNEIEYEISGNQVPVGYPNMGFWPKTNNSGTEKEKLRNSFESFPTESR